MRYTEDIRITTTDLDKYGDVVGWIEGLRSQQYLADLLREKHAIPNPSTLAKTIKPLIETALNYIDQAETGPSRVAFLPLYYSMLNLAKVYVLLGPYRDELETQRRHRGHGASYDPGWNDSIDLRRQKIRMREDGVLGLFYRTLTGDPWLTVGTDISMAQIYPFMERVGAEYLMLTGEPEKITEIDLTLKKIGDQFHLGVEIDESGVPHETELDYLSVLRKDHWDDWNAAEGKGTSLHSSTIQSLTEILNCCTRREMFRGSKVSQTAVNQTCITCTVPIKSGFPRMVEEIPIFLSFFYQSSIARYKPEFLYKQFDSKLWPFLVALRRHGSFSFLLAFWQFIRQESLSIVSI